jgi:hypothetical protein
LGKGVRGFLRQIVPDAALDDPVGVFAGEFLGVEVVRTGEISLLRRFRSDADGNSQPPAPWTDRRICETGRSRRGAPDRKTQKIDLDLVIAAIAKSSPSIHKTIDIGTRRYHLSANGGT